MAGSFENTTRALSADGARGGHWLQLGLCLLLLAWGGWFVLARVPAYQVADVAALDGIVAAHPVAAEVEGRVASARLELGRAVVAGEVLVGLERYGEAEALNREALQAIHAAFRPEHTDIAVLHNNLGALLRETGRPAEAEVTRSPRDRNGSCTSSHQRGVPLS